jgi:hypothetical protein
VRVRPLLPGVAQRDAVRAGHFHREHELGRPEARAVDDAVDRVQGAVGGDHAVLGHPGDRVGDEVDVGLLQRGQVARAEQHRLQPKVKSGQALARTTGIAQLHPHEGRRPQAADPPERARVADHRGQPSV